MAYCQECHKFRGYDDSTEPEVEINHEIEENEVVITGSVRITLNCDDCNSELRGAEFEIQDLPAVDITGHTEGEHEIDVEPDTFELVSRTEGKGRSMKTFWGYDGDITVSCSCKGLMDPASNTEGVTVHVKDDIQASNLDDLQ